MSDDDADIDALMGSVLGHDGTTAVFPPMPARPAPARIAPPRLRLVTADVDADDADLVVPGDEQADTPLPTRRGPAGMAKLSAAVQAASAELAAQIEENVIIDPRSVPARFSNLKHIARSALHYWDAVQLGRDDTLAMRIGRGAHAMVLGMPVVLYPGKVRRGREFERWKAGQDPTAEILIRSEWERAKGIANAIKNHPIGGPRAVAGPGVEETIVWEWLGKACTSRPDSRRADGRFVTDLKTTQCAEPDKFRRDAMSRGYDAQLAFYDLASKHLTGRDADELYAVAVESKRPYAVTVLRLTDEARERGRKLCRLWMEQLLTYEAANHWPAYVDRIVDLDVTADDGELKLTIDGEDYDFDAEESR